MFFFQKWPDIQHTTSKVMFLHSEQNWKNVIQKQSFADFLQNRCSKNFANFTGKHLFWSLFLKRLQGWGPATLSKGDSNTGISVEVFEIFKDIFFYKTPPVAASGDNKPQISSLPWVNRRFRLTQRVTFLSQPIIYSFIDDKNKETLIKKFFRLS